MKFKLTIWKINRKCYAVKIIFLGSLKLPGFRVLFGCNSAFEHPAYLNSGKKPCGSIYLLSFGGNYSCAPSEIPRLEYQ